MNKIKIIANHRLLSAGIFAATVCFCLIYWLTHTDEVVLAATEEDAFIQQATNVTYILCIIPALYYSLKDRRVFAAALILILFLLRENDLHKIYQDQGFLKEPFYVSPHIPYAYKVWGFSMLVGLAVFLLYLTRYIKPVINGLRTGRVWAISTVLTIIVLGISKNLDGLNRTLAKIHQHVPPALPTLLEETLELILPVLILLSLYQFLSTRPARAAFARNQA